jgi:hypothetical protein
VQQSFWWSVLACLIRSPTNLLWRLVLDSVVLFRSLEDTDIGAEGAAAIAAAVRASPGVLRDLKGIDLRTADPHLPLELRASDNRHILDFYRDLLRSDAVVSRRVRVMLLGVGGVGKTTLANRLASGAPDDAVVPVTHGALQRACMRHASTYVHTVCLTQDDFNQAHGLRHTV